MSEASGQRVGLTARGASTRLRIIEAAADLMYVRGVGATTLDDVVAVCKVSKSQLYRHFDDKGALVRAVVEHVGDRIINGERRLLMNVSTFTGLRRWRDAIVEHNAVRSGRYGCPLGALAVEVAEHDAVARTKLNELFAAWEELFDVILRRFQSQRLLPSDVDVARLSVAFLAAVQGGYLLAQTARDVDPMAAAIDVFIDHLQMLADQERAVSAAALAD